MIAAASRVLLVVAIFSLILVTTPWATAQGTAVTTYHNDNARTGQNLNETMLTPANVNSNSFGLVGFLPTTGLVDGEPLYVPNVNIKGTPHNVIYIADEQDWVYAYDADSFVLLWKVQIVGAGETPSDDRGCSQVTPYVDAGD